MKNFRLKLSVILLFMPVLIFAKNYTVNKGGSLKVNCTANAPADGWITHAFYSLVDPEDSKYLGIAYNSSDCQATYYGLDAKSNIKVEVTYAYSYKSPYSSAIQVGHGSYYDYVTVNGPKNATSFSIREGNEITMKTGQTIVLHADFYPAGSFRNLEWGSITALGGQPWNFDVSYKLDPAECTIKAKKAGWFNLLVMFEGDQKSVEILTITAKDDVALESPTSVSIQPSEITLNVGDVYQLNPQFSPANTFAETTWKSSDNSIIGVDESGNITAFKAGKAKITLQTDNDLNATAEVTVIPVATGFSLPSSINVNLGYTYQFTPNFTPTGAKGTITWKSSDTSIATVSVSGVVNAKKEGVVTITATDKKLNLTKDVEVRIKAPAKEYDARNTTIKIQNIKGMINNTMINK